MADDPAFIWERRSPDPRRPARPAASSPGQKPAPEAAPPAPPRPDAERITLRDAEHRFGITVSTLRTWARKGVIEGALEEGPSGRQWMVTPGSIAHHLSRAGRPERGRPASRGTPAPGRTGPTADGTSMLVPRDAWDKLIDQLGNLHEAGLMLAEARERAAKAETEATFLRERLAEMRAERDALRPGDPSAPHPARRPWWRFGRS